MIQKESYYEILEVPNEATDKEIKRHYHVLASKWHPHKNSIGRIRAEKYFTEISEAYEVLSNRRLRRAFDDDGFEGVLNCPNTRFDFSNFTLANAEKVFEKFTNGRDPFAMLEEDDPFFDDEFFDIDHADFFERSEPASRYFETVSNSSKKVVKSPRSNATEKSTKTVIVDKDGRRVKKTITTITNADGSQEVIEEESEEPSNRYLRE